MTTEVNPMEVVFTQDVPNKARAGEVRNVPDGYARNYLLPQGLAVMSTPEVLKRLHKIKSAGDAVRLRETKVLEELKEALDDTEITVQARVTPDRPLLRRHHEHPHLHGAGRGGRARGGAALDRGGRANSRARRIRHYAAFLH